MSGDISIEWGFKRIDLDKTDVQVYVALFSLLRAGDDFYLEIDHEERMRIFNLFARYKSKVGKVHLILVSRKNGNGFHFDAIDSRLIE